MKTLITACSVLLMLSLGFSMTLPAAAQPDYAKQVPWEWQRSDIGQLNGYARRVSEENGTWVFDNGNWRVKTDVSAKFTVEVAYYLEQFRQAIVRAAELRSLNDTVTPTVELYQDARRLSQRTREDNLRSGSFEFSWQSNKQGDPKADIEQAYFIAQVSGGPQAEFAEYIDSAAGETLRREAARAVLQLYFGPHRGPAWLYEAFMNYFINFDLRLNPRDNDRRAAYLIYNASYWQDMFDRKETPRLNPVLSGTSADAAALASVYDAMRFSRDAKGVGNALLQRIRNDQTADLITREVDKLEGGWHQQIGQMYRALSRM